MGRSATLALFFGAAAAAALAAPSPATQPAATQPTPDHLTTPVPADFVRYERLNSRFHTTALPKAHGDAIVAALHGGASLIDWGADVRAHEKPGQENMIVDPIPTNIEVDAIRKDGTRYPIALSFNGGLVDLPNGQSRTLYVLTPPADAEMKTAVDDIQHDLRDIILNAPRPTTYTIGLLDDDGSLSGVARVVYNNPNRWKDIYAANKSHIKNPNQIPADLKLIIPK